MPNIKRTEENIEKLANAVIDTWGMDELIHYAREQLIDNYKLNLDSFNDDWDQVIENN